MPTFCVLFASVLVYALVFERGATRRLLLRTKSLPQYLDVASLYDMEGEGESVCVA